MYVLPFNRIVPGGLAFDDLHLVKENIDLEK